MRRLIPLALMLLAGCGSAPKQPASPEEGTLPYGTREAAPASPSRGGYYKTDGPGNDVPDIDKIEDAEPRAEPMHRFANNPYVALGRSFSPMRWIAPFRQRGLASWYGKMFHGQKTSSGEIYDMYGMTAAHPTLPIPSYAKVTNLRNNRSVVVRINDRGPFHAGRIIDLSFAAAAKLGYIDSGSVQAEVELIQLEDFSRYARRVQPVLAAGGESGPAGAARPGAQRPASPAPAALVSSVQAAGSPAEAGAIYLQLGSFSVRENAEVLRSRVVRELAWLKDFVEVLPRDGGFRVQVGPYKNRGDAAGAAEKIRESMQISPILLAR